LTVVCYFATPWPSDAAASLLCLQERAPTSVAYAENQSMFLDSLAGDAAWLGRYAVSREGQVMPWSVVQQMINDTHPYEVFQVCRCSLLVAVGSSRLHRMHVLSVVQ
jgi:hypothetical protein